MRKSVLWFGMIALVASTVSCTPSSEQSTASSASPSPLPPPPPGIPKTSATATPLPVPSASPNPATDTAGKVTLADGRIAFTLPSGFTPLTQEEIALKFPRNANPPTYAYGNARRNVTIAITFSAANLKPEQLPELKSVLRPQISKSLPNLEWLKDELIPINRTQWLHYEFVSQAIDTKVHNDAYFTSFDGKMLGINFNATVAEWDNAQTELMKMRDSIVVQ